MQKLLSDHDRAVDAARKLEQLAAQSGLTEQEAQNGASYARNFLPHVFECDGLSIMVELLPDETMQQVLDARGRSLGANLDILRWTDTVRGHAAGATSV